MKLLILFTTIPLSLLLLLLPIASPHDHHPTLHTTSHIQPTTTTSSAMAAAYHCSSTPYPSLCISTLTSTIPNLPSKTLPQIITSSINHTATSVHSSASATAALLRSRLPSLEPLQRIALSDCLDLFDQTISDFNRAVVDLTKHPTSTGDDLKTVLSAAMTNQFTCLDGFAYVNDAESLRPLIEDRLFSISQLVGNSLALSKKIPTAKKKIGEVFEEYGSVVKGFPKWISDKDQNLLHGNVTVADLVVAKDGSGNFTTITEAVDAAPNSSHTRFLIYIKAGAYFENVEVGKKKTNLIFVGDGIGKTVVKASRNVVDGWTTYRSATLAVVGNGFLARDITIENEAGPSKHQAVALRNGADLSAFYRCSFVGYQDTLYVHSMRQFFRECDIYGTVDFIFGNAAVVLQNCNLYARKPDPNQKNIYTAQGREDPNQNTGISIQNCKVAAASDLIPVQSEFKTYLGRPWKAYSRTVVLESYLGSLIEPEGWLEWDGNFALDTLYYGEYKNHGPGSNTTARVNWAGYRVINSTTEANRFTVENFIDADEWLASTSVPFTAGLV